LLIVSQEFIPANQPDKYGSTALKELIYNTHFLFVYMMPSLFTRQNEKKENQSSIN
jgi:hypothetical protein